MKIKAIKFSSKFLKNLRKLLPEHKTNIDERLIIFKNDCFNPLLNTHKLKGNLKKYWSFSITHSHRIIFEIYKNGEAGFIDIGGHSIYK